MDISIDQYKQDGLIVINDFYTKTENSNLKNLCNYIVRNDVDRYSHDRDFIRVFEQSTMHFLRLHLNFKNFSDLIDSKRMLAIAQNLYGKKMELWSSLLLYGPSNSDQGQSWHQDLDPTKLYFTACNMLTYPFGLDSESSLRVVKKSYNYGRIPSGGAFDHLENECEVIVGPRDLVILDCGMFHMVPKNTTSRDRYALNVRFIDSDFSDNEYTSVGVYRTGSYNFSTNSTIEH